MIVAAGLFAPGPARATNVQEFPDNGSEQMARGGAWVARASDPLAAFYNPAGLAGQPTRFTVQSNVTLRHTCFARQKAANDTSLDTLAGPSGAFPEVCNDTTPSVGPQVGLTYRLTDRIGIGFLPILAPSAAGNLTWPEFVSGPGGLQPSPSRYLLIKGNAIVLSPTLGAGIEIVDGLRLGASVQWGVASLNFSRAVVAINQDGLSPSTNDVKAELSAKDLFIPGFTLGALWSPTSSVDVAAWYRWSAPLDAKGDVKTYAKYFTSDVANGNQSAVKTGDTSLPDCGVGNANSACGNGDNGTVKVPIPMEAKVGVRYHRPVAPAPVPSHSRDPLADDLFDVELDLTWANNSAFDTLTLRFPGDQNGNGTLPTPVPGGTIPPNGDTRYHFYDVYGARLGGDYAVVPDRIAVRAGMFYETRGQDQTFQNIDFAGAQRFGIAAGGTYRVRLGNGAAVELSLGYGHIFFGTQDDKDPNGVGAPGLAGTPCNDTTPPPPGDTCSTGRQKYRTNWAVNLGTITNSINVFNVGASYRF